MGDKLPSGDPQELAVKIDKALQKGVAISLSSFYASAFGYLCWDNDSPMNFLLVLVQSDFLRGIFRWKSNRGGLCEGCA